MADRAPICGDSENGWTRAFVATMGIANLGHLPPVGMVLSVIRWARAQADIRARERTVVRREQVVATRTQQLDELETAERNLANQRWGGLELDVPQIVRAYWDASGRVDLTLSYTIRNRRALSGFVETVQGSIMWPSGFVTQLEAKRVDQQLSGGSAYSFSRTVQWMVRDDQLVWLTAQHKRIALASCSVTLEIFARLGGEVVRMELTNHPVELLVSG